MHTRSLDMLQTVTATLPTKLLDGGTANLSPGQSVPGSAIFTLTSLWNQGKQRPNSSFYGETQKNRLLLSI